MGEATKQKTFSQTLFKRLFRHKLAVIGLSIIALLILVSIIADFIAPDPYVMNLDADLIPPMKQPYAARSVEKYPKNEYLYIVEETVKGDTVKKDGVSYQKIGEALDIRLSSGESIVAPTSTGTLSPDYEIQGVSEKFSTYRSTQSVKVEKYLLRYDVKGDHIKQTKELVEGDLEVITWEDLGVAYLVEDHKTGIRRLHPKDSNDLTPTEVEIGPAKAPLLGTDAAGRDIAQRMIHGARISLYIGIVVMFISLLIGIPLGAIAGFYGGKLDSVIMRFTDIMFAFPGLLFAIAVMAVLGRDLFNVFIALGLVGWPPIARIIRGEVVALKETEFVEAARSIGATNKRIIIRHLLPNMLAPIIVYVSLGIAGAIMSEAGLSFLGIGVKPPMPSWGSMINEGFQHALNAPHVWLVPGVVIALVVLAFNFLGDGLRDALDPKLKI
ncbi:MAG TPA: ABC transporter permease [Caldisericia bacterium]|nr:ABC transporter permease [Caldisericia bacterium]HPF48260.1 ABC transporter permease [Caldisericia bacterium]HPI83804.1 ABC transporter permease [Caldisericia bacterium]HPQ92713.1 ABC transporter permease [Caldisericia bacterium]HRV74189.1 ABC transporter permease [Caldisericia bacterium]